MEKKNSWLKDLKGRYIRHGQKVWWEEIIEQYAEPTEEQMEKHKKDMLKRTDLSGSFPYPQGEKIEPKVIGHTGTVKLDFYGENDYESERGYGWIVKEKGTEQYEYDYETLANLYERLTIITPKKK